MPNSPKLIFSQIIRKRKRRKGFLTEIAGSRHGVAVFIMARTRLRTVYPKLPRLTCQIAAKKKKEEIVSKTAIE